MSDKQDIYPISGVNCDMNGEPFRLSEFHIPLGGNTFIYNGPSAKELMNIRHDCLQMAVQHATREQVEDGTVYRIANDYYNYIVNNKSR